MRRKAASAVVISATLYAALLCAIHTNIAPISNDILAAADAAITLAALGLALFGAPGSTWLLLFLRGTNAVWLFAISADFDVKGAIRDPLVLIGFTLLGMTCATFARARLLFVSLSAVVLVVAVFELIAPQLYTSVFNVLSFYQGRGVVSGEAAQYADTSLFISGMRPGGRLLLPFLGQHRVSSIFLEPVSMGNFGALAVAFALAIPMKHWRSATAIGMIGLVAIVLADARFALLASGLFLAARFVPIRWMNVALVAMPLVGIPLLFYAAHSFAPEGDDLPGRLATSGRVLESLRLGQIVGAAPHSVSTVDAGYAYAITELGLPFCVVLWGAFVMLRTPTAHAQRYKFFLGIYACTLLCVSGTSLFALKTAGLAWFALGAMAAEAYALRAVIGARSLVPLPVRR
jgi:putative polymerase